jgi:hypothetical protein
MKDIASMTLLEIARHYHRLAAAYHKSEGGVKETRALNEFEDALRELDVRLSRTYPLSSLPPGWEGTFTATAKIAVGEDYLEATRCAIHGVFLTTTGICTICQANRE